MLTEREFNALDSKLTRKDSMSDFCRSRMVRDGWFDEEIPLENHSGEVENCYADHPKLDEPKQPFTVRWKNPSDWFQQHMKKG